MFRQTIFFSAVILLLSAMAWADSWKGSDADRLASLAGNWAVVDSEGTLTDLRASYLVLARGAGVMETLFAHTPEETVTVYYVEKKELAATQLSGRGGPVHLRAARTKERDTLYFETAAAKSDGSGLRSVRLTRLDDERLRVEWTFLTDGAEGESRAFELRREATVEELAAEVGRLRVSVESLQREIDRRLKNAVILDPNSKSSKKFLETRTLPPGPGWSVSGVAFRRFLLDQTVPFASTFASKGDPGMTVGHFGFEAGAGCRLRFSVLGGHGFIAVVDEKRAPPRRIASIPDFAVDLEGGEYGTIIEKIVGGHWSKHAIAVEWDLSRFEGKSLRLYVVDAETDHYGQIALSEVSLIETATE